MAQQEAKRPTVVCSAFVEKDGKFLLVFCPRFKVWRVPGGRTEWNETLKQTLTREMREELGVEFKNPKFLGYGQDHQYHFINEKETSRLLMFFHVKTDKKLRIDPSEAEDFKWLTFGQLKKQPDKEGALSDFLRRNPNLKL
jgi:ADP-ribose pyrophosphatase YjhB (NUDIX family)